MDYGRPIQFGYFVLPDSMRPMRPLELAVRAEKLGELIGIQDHPYQRRFYDTWTLLTAIAMRTERVTVFPDVANLPLRPPAMLAKAAASLDLLSNGRVELGLGAGGFWDAIKAMGGSVRTPGEAVSALEEAIQVIRLVWSGRPLRRQVLPARRPECGPATGAPDRHLARCLQAEDAPAGRARRRWLGAVARCAKAR